MSEQQGGQQISPDGQWRWNGSEWIPNTPQYSAGAPGPVPSAASPQPQKPRSGKGKKVALGLGGGFVALIILGAIAGGSEDAGTPSSESSSVASESIDEPAAEEPSDEPTAEESSDEPTAEESSDEPAAEPAGLKKRDHEPVTKRELAKIVKDPDRYVGENIIVYAEVTQFDSATGTDTFRGSVAHQDITEFGYWIGGDNSLFTGDEEALEDVVAEDVVKVWVTVGGSFSYETQIGGETTVPVFAVNFVNVIGTSSP